MNRIVNGRSSLARAIARFVVLACLVSVLPWAAKALAKDEAGDEVITLVIGLLGEKDKDLRSVGLDQIRTDAKGEAATRRFAAELPKLSPEAQAGLVSALADRGDAAARPAIVALLGTTSDETVKLATIAAVGSLGNVGDLPLLIDKAAKGSEAEQAVAVGAITRLRGEEVPRAIVATAKQATETPLRVTLIDILAERRALDTVSDLVSLARDPDAKVRAAAMGALAAMAGPGEIPGMIDGVLAAQKGAERTAAERAVAKVCSRIPDPAQQAAPVLAAIEGHPPADRAVLLVTLARVGGPAALEQVAAAIADPARHDAGVPALCAWPDASVAPRLLDLFEHDAHPQHRAQALAALIRVAPLDDGRSNDERLALLKKVIGLCTRSEDQNQAIERARAIYTVDSLRFVVPYLDQPEHVQSACDTVVELAHHRDIRDANKPEFMAALDRVLQLSKNDTTLERANLYKAGKTWNRPKKADK
ncbi:MAG TPA: HEAT repeat domain-containing protein [Pirellulales bacterium]|nr:HEAT repeat domain-containing protein [Pirellulales bacterium]